MRYNTRTWNPILIAIPDFGVGVFWALSGTIVPWIIYRYTQASWKIGLLLSLGALTGCFVQIISGALSDRTRSKWGKRTPWILFGVLLAVIAQLLWGVMPNYWSLLGIAFITYFFVNFYQGPYYSMVMEVVDKDQVAYANTLARTTAQFGATAISFVSAWIWTRGVWASLIVIALFMVVPVVAVLPGVIKERVDHFELTTSFRFSFDFVKYPRVVQLYATAFFIYAGYGILIPTMTPYFVKHLHFSHEAIGMAMTVYGVCSIIFGFASGRFTDRVSKRLSLILAMCLFAFALFLGAFVRHSEMFLYIFIGIAGVGYLFSQIGLFSMLSVVVPPGRLGEFVGILNLFVSASQFFIMNIMGVWLSHGGAPYVYPAAVVALLIAIAIFLPKMPEKWGKEK